MPVLVPRPTFAAIDLDNLEFNFRSAMNFIGSGVECMAMVKSDAYGHGAVECSKRLEKCGAASFGVALLEEGAELRDAGITKPIIVLGGVWPGQESSLLELGLTPVIFTLDQARSMNDAAKAARTIARVHVKIDTGMGRVGVPHDEAAGFAQTISSLSHIEIEGLMTHFASADDLEQTDFTNEQIRRFDRAVEEFRSAGIEPKYLDMANSPASIVYPGSRRSLVRLGGILYGLGGDVIPKGVPAPELKPVLSLTTRIAMIKTVRKGESVGYGRSFVVEHDLLIATLPIGYRDGLSRALSNRGEVLIRGKRVPIVGRVSMDWITVDVTDLPSAAVGDEAVIIGRQGDEVITAEDLAKIEGTISYEVTCSISQRVPRRIVSR